MGEGNHLQLHRARALYSQVGLVCNARKFDGATVYMNDQSEFGRRGGLLPIVPSLFLTVHQRCISDMTCITSPLLKVISLGTSELAVSNNQVL